MRFTIHTGLKTTLFESHHCRIRSAKKERLETTEVTPNGQSKPPHGRLDGYR